MYYQMELQLLITSKLMIDSSTTSLIANCAKLAKQRDVSLHAMMLAKQS